MAQPLNTTGVTTGGTTSGGGLDFDNLIPQILEKFLLVLEGVAIIAAGFFVIRFLRNKLHKIEIAHEPQRNAINLLEKITTGFIVVICITLALKVVGIDMTLLVSVAILGLSYGLQDVIKNYVAGILILFKAPFKIGETVQIRGYTGRIYKMDFQSTTLETFDHRYITIYNSDVMTQSIINYSNNTIRRIDIDMMLGYGSDVKNALLIFDKILLNHPAVLKNPKYNVIFKKFSDSAITFTLKFWVQRPCNILKIRSEIGLQLSQSFDEQHIFMPYTKDVQGTEENDLTKITEEHKKHIQEFYSLPMFTQQAAPPEGIVGPDGQIQPVEEIDTEEPEAL